MKSDREVIFMPKNESPPSRGAWIEISPAGCVGGYSQVAPLAGGVD